MGLTELIVSGIALLFIGSMIYVANWQDASGEHGAVLRWMLFVVIGMSLYAGLNVLVVGFLPQDTLAEVESSLPAIDKTGALVSFSVTLLMAVTSLTMVLSVRARQGLRRILSSSATYNPDSSVHLVAVVLSLALVSVMVSNFVLGGGLAGIAEMIETTGIAAGQVAFEGLIWVIVAFLGVGLAVRRAFPQALERLGLRVPTRQDVAAGIGAGSILFIVQVAILLVWARLVSPELFTDQTVAAEQIGQAINSLPLAFLVSLSAGIGEEVFFRGALQPVFGLVPTSILFVAIHSQYTLTPAAALLLVVALGLGWVRIRYGTTAAIIAHFAYNFIPLAMSLLLGSMLGT